MEALFERITAQWGRLDFVLHSIAFLPKEPVKSRRRCRAGRLSSTMDVSCWTFIRMAHLAEPLMRKGGTLFTMTYYGSQRVVKNYNIMGVAKAALEAAVRYLAAELGPKDVACTRYLPGRSRIHALAFRNRSAARQSQGNSARSLVSIDGVGVATAFLAHDAARVIAAEHFT